jgi:hypothetical protein
LSPGSEIVRAGTPGEKEGGMFFAGGGDMSKQQSQAGCLSKVCSSKMVAVSRYILRVDGHQEDAIPQVTHCAEASIFYPNISESDAVSSPLCLAAFS